MVSKGCGTGQVAGWEALGDPHGVSRQSFYERFVKYVPRWGTGMNEIDLSIYHPGTHFPVCLASQGE